MIADDEATALARIRTEVSDVSAAATFLVLARVLFPPNIAGSAQGQSRADALPRLADVVIGGYADLRRECR